MSKLHSLNEKDQEKSPYKKSTEKILRLQKYVYGLADAGRYWCLLVKQKLLRLGSIISSNDPEIFLWKENNLLQGTIICHVKDIVYDGN